MRRWSEVAGRVSATTRTSEKTAILAEYLASLGHHFPGPVQIGDRAP